MAELALILCPSFPLIHTRTGQIEIRWARIITPHLSSLQVYLFGNRNGDQESLARHFLVVVSYLPSPRTPRRKHVK